MLRLTCPGCEKVVRVPEEKAGKAVKCPAWKTALTVPDDEADEDSERPRRKGAKSRGKAAAGGGSSWKLYAGIGGGLVVVAIVLVLAFGKRKPGEGGGPDGGIPGLTGANTGGGLRNVSADGIARIRTEANTPGSMRYTLQGGWGDDGYFGVVLFKPKVLTKEEAQQLGTKRPPGEYRMTVYNAGTGEQVKTVTLAGQRTGGEPISHMASLSPDAKHMATVSAYTPNTVRLVDLDSGQVAEFVPNAAPGKKQPDASNVLHWLAFLAPDRLLTVTNTGGYDIWTVPGLQRVGGQPGVTIQFGDMSVHAVDGVPNVASLSADRKTLARFNGTGISVVDLATGNQIGRTEDFYKLERLSLLVVHIALSPDAKRVYALVTIKDDIWRYRLVEFDVATGKKQREMVIAKEPTEAGTPGMYFWGPDHLVVGHSTARNTRHMVHLPTLALMSPVEIGSPPRIDFRMIGGNLGGRLWYAGQDAAGKPTYLFGVLPSALPAEPDDKKRWAIPVNLGE